MEPELSVLRRSQDAWLDSHAERGHSAKTREVYGLGLRQLAEFLEKRGCERPTAVTAGDLGAWLAELQGAGLAPSSLSVYLRAARGWFRWLHDRGEIFWDPASELRSPRIVRSRQGVPSVADIKKLLGGVAVDSAVGVRDRAILETAYATALRRRELAGLKTSDVDLAQRTVRVVGKGGRERVVPLTHEATNWLRRYLDSGRRRFLGNRPAEALWLNQRGGPLAPFSLAIMIRNRARACGLPQITPHALRRACATHLLANGAHPAELQQLLGHSSFRHLSQYLQLGFRALRAMHAKSRPGQ